MKKLVPFAVIFLLINFALSILFMMMMDESQLLVADNKMKLNRPFNFLVIGNSHALALQEEQMPNTNNIASYGEQLQNTYFKLEFYLKNNPKPAKGVIMSYDLGIVRRLEIDNQPYQFYWNRYEHRAGLMRYSEKRTSFVLSRLSSLLFPYKDGEVDAFDYLFADQQTRNIASMRDQGKINKLPVDAQRQISEDCIMREISEAGLYYFKQIIKLCKKNDVKLYLVRFPVTPLHQFNLSKCYDPEEFYQRVQVSSFGNSPIVEVLDFHNQYDESYFRDPHHLKGGATREEFSKMVFDQISE